MMPGFNSTGCTLHHLGIAVSSIPDAQAAFCTLFGLTPVSEPIVDPIQHVKVCFLASGSPSGLLLELVEPATNDSAIGAILRRGGGAYHLCYQVGDLDAELERMRAERCLIVSGATPAVAFGGRRIAWLYTPQRQLVELLEQ